jgi:hypothetical protein
MLENRDNYSARAKKLRKTLLKKGTKHTAVKTDKSGKVKSKTKTGNDLMKNKKKSFKNKFDMKLKLNKVRRARALRNRQIKA